MGTVIKNARARKADLSKRPLNQDLKDIPGQRNRIFEDLGAGRI